jgi:hypothetical protein
MDLECPYCEVELDVCHDDGFGYQEGVKHQMQCSNCNKSFVFETSISFYYEPEKADCLNDGEHEWKPTNTYPKEYTRMECVSCGESRSPTKSELESILTHKPKSL